MNVHGRVGNWSCRKNDPNWNLARTLELTPSFLRRASLITHEERGFRIQLRDQSTKGPSHPCTTLGLLTWEKLLPAGSSTPILVARRISHWNTNSALQAWAYQEETRSDLTHVNLWSFHPHSASQPHIKCISPQNASPPSSHVGSAGDQYLLRVPLGLEVRVQAPDQGHPVPRLPLQQPVIVEPLHELVLPLEGEATADFVQPKGSKEVSWSQLQRNHDSADPGDTIRFPNKASRCSVNAHSELHMQLVHMGCAYFSQHIPVLVPAQMEVLTKVLPQHSQTMQSSIRLQALISKLLSVSRTFQGAI